MNHWSHLWALFFSEDETAYHTIWTIIVSVHVCVYVYSTKGRRVEKRRCWTIDSCGTNIRACPNSQESHSSPPYPSGSVWVPSVTPKPNPTLPFLYKSLSTLSYSPPFLFQLHPLSPQLPVFWSTLPRGLCEVSTFYFLSLLVYFLSFSLCHSTCDLCFPPIAALGFLCLSLISEYVKTYLSF